MAIAQILGSIINITTKVQGISKVNFLSKKFIELGGTTKQYNNILKNVTKTFSIFTNKAKSFAFDRIFKPPGMQSNSLFKMARGINTLAANIRFFQLTLMMFIGGGVIRGFIGAFITLNAEIQSASLSLEAIIQSQKDIAIKKDYGIGNSDLFPKPLQMKALKEATKDAKELTKYAVELALRSGGPIDETIRAARGIQVNTNDILLTKKMLDSAVQLSLLDPQQGMKGATFSIRELLQGQGSRDFKSLSQRFELSFSLAFKRKFTQSVQSGKIKEAVDLFQQALAGKGITEKILSKLEKSWILSFNVIKGYGRLALAEIGEPLFDRLNKFGYQYSKLFIGSGDAVKKSVEYQMVTRNFGDILDVYIGKPLIKYVDKLSTYMVSFLSDPNTFSFIRKQLDQLQAIGSQISTIFKTIGTSFFSTLGVLDKNGDLFKSSLNFLSLITNKVGEFLDKFVNSGGLSVINKYVSAWAEYYNTLFSDKNINAMILFTMLSLQYNTMFIKMHTTMVSFMGSMAPLINFFGQLALVITNFIWDIVSIPLKILELIGSSMGITIDAFGALLTGQTKEKGPELRQRSMDVIDLSSEILFGSKISDLPTRYQDLDTQSSIRDFDDKMNIQTTSSEQSARLERLIEAMRSNNKIAEEAIALSKTGNGLTDQILQEAIKAHLFEQDKLLDVDVEISTEIGI